MELENTIITISGFSFTIREMIETTDLLISKLDFDNQSKQEKMDLINHLIEVLLILKEKECLFNERVAKKYSSYFSILKKLVPSEQEYSKLFGVSKL